MADRVGPYSTAPGPRRKFGQLTIWAEDGLVVTEDVDGEVRVLTVKVAEERMRGGLIDELDVWDRQRDDSSDMVLRAKAIERYHVYRRMLEELDETIKDAKQQGDQSNEEVRIKKLAAFLRGRRTALQSQHTLPSLDSVISSLATQKDK